MNQNKVYSSNCKILPYIYMASVLNIALYPFTRHFSFIDELLVVALACFGLIYSKFKFKQEILLTFSILIFFFIFSIFKGTNVWQASCLDFVLFLKPFISFYVASTVPFLLSKKQRNICCTILIFIAIFLVVQAPFLNQIYNNTTTYYQCCMHCGVAYYFFSSKNKKNSFITIAIFSFGLLSIRAKYFAEFVFFVYIILFLNKKIRISVKHLLLISILISIVLFINYEKTKHYLSDESLVRTKFYYHIKEVIVDYLPLGPGFGTYNTEGAARYYSPLYEKYGFSTIWGARPVDYRTGADFLRDTFYPALAQFGIWGYILFGLFWKKRWDESKKYNIAEYKIFLLVLTIEFIQNIAANAFTGGDGVAIMMMFGLLYNVNKSQNILNKDNGYAIDLNIREDRNDK